jgi:GTPase SAR1 family protein
MEYLFFQWRNAKLILAVYDVTNEQSLENITHWMQMIREVNSTNIPTVLFANKIDLTKRRVINSQKGEEMAQRLGMFKYIEGSAVCNIFCYYILR